MAVLDESGQKHLSKIFDALANPTRLKILSMIEQTERPLHIKAVARELQMDYAAVYRHVDVLKKAGLIQIFEVGRSRVLSPRRDDVLGQIFALAQRMESK